MDVSDGGKYGKRLEKMQSGDADYYAYLEDQVRWQASY